MKKGLIIYITGIEPEGKAISLKSFDDFSKDYDMLEFVSPLSGRADIHEAWFNLVVKGIHSINCRFGFFTPNGDLELTERVMRVC